VLAPGTHCPPLAGNARPTPLWNENGQADSADYMGNLDKNNTILTKKQRRETIPGARRLT